MNESDTLLIEQIKNHKTPSVQYFFFDKDKILGKFLGGFADIKNQRKTTENTTYNGYSVTKTFTALAILQLAALKEIDIGEYIKSYLPEFPYSDDITIRQLMAHTAGIPNPIPLSWIHLATEHRSFDGHSFFDQVFAKNNKVKSGPNEKFAYSNLGYVLLGRLIEKVSGLSYEEFVRHNILNRLNIEQGEMDFTIADTYRHAKGYHKKLSFSNVVLGFLIDKSKFMEPMAEGRWKVFKDNYVNVASYGGLIGTPMAFVKYIQELLRPNCNLISDEYKKLLFTDNYTNNKRATAMCLSWFSGQLNGHRYCAHAGGGGGYYCEIRIYPDTGVGSVIMFNRTGMKDERFLDKLDRYAL